MLLFRQDQNQVRPAVPPGFKRASCLITLIAHRGFNTLLLACMLDSLIRVSRRDICVPLSAYNPVPVTDWTLQPFLCLMAQHDWVQKLRAMLPKIVNRTGPTRRKDLRLGSFVSKPKASADSALSNRYNHFSQQLTTSRGHLL